MAELSKLNDQQNMLLTQLAYSSHVFIDDYNGKTLSEIATKIQDKDVDKDTKKILKEICDAGMGNLKIKDFGNDSISGFGAIAFTDESGATGFSYRGTDGLEWESLNDWGDNILAMLTGTSIQTAQAESFFDKNRDNLGNNYLYGHSKGGELSESVFVNNHKRIKGVHLLNPQPINPYSLSKDQKEAIKSDKVDIVVIECDYVWFLGKLPSYGNIRFAKNNGGNSHLYSSIEDMFDDNGNITDGNQPWWEFAKYFGITILTNGFQRIGGAYGLVYNSAVRLIDYVRSDLILEAKEFIAWVSDEVKKIGNDLKDFADELNNFLLATVNNVRNWYNGTFNKGNISTAELQVISVDTQKLRSYAQRLQSVNSRVSRLDSRLDSLYWNVGLLGLWNLMQADMLTGYSWRLNRCSSYLNETANDLEQIEQNLKNVI